MTINPIALLKIDASNTTHTPVMSDGSETVPVEVIPLSADAGQILSIGTDSGLYVTQPDIATQLDITNGVEDKVIDAAGLKMAGITAAAIGTIADKNGGYLKDDQYIRLRNVRTISNGHAYTPAFRVTYRDFETARFVQLFGDETVGTSFGAVLGVQLASGSGFNYEFRSTGVAYGGNWSTSSDRRIKTEVEPIKNPLEAIQKLNGCTFLKNGLPSAGLIAQDVQEVLPQAVTNSGDFQLQDGAAIKDCLSVDYAALACLYVEAIKELADRVEKLEKN